MILCETYIYLWWKRNCENLWFEKVHVMRMSVAKPEELAYENGGGGGGGDASK